MAEIIIGLVGLPIFLWIAWVSGNRDYVEDQLNNKEDSDLEG